MSSVANIFGTNYNISTTTHINSSNNQIAEISNSISSLIELQLLDLYN
jgi:hypothetical protein